VKALKEIGLKKAAKFFFWTLVYTGFRLILFPQARTIYLRLCGAKIGKNCIIHGVKFFNYYRGGFSGLKIGNDCFLGNDVVLDLAASIILEDQVTLAERSMIITHLNVGYLDHPLQKTFPSSSRPVTIERGSFVGANSVILDGVIIGAGSFISASAVINESVPPHSLAGGIPGKVIKTLNS
jgi:acetyltransferase-like isoleucine patch superfamily enzyme